MVVKSAELIKKPEEQKITLQTVRGALSKDVFDNPTWKGLYYFVKDVILFGIIFTVLWNVNEWYFVLPLWILAGFSISSLFIIGHDACHGALFKNEKLAHFIGQLAMLPSFHAYSHWAFGHNKVHHGHTIRWGADFVWHPTSPEEYKKLSFFGKAMHKLYWSPLGAGFYYGIVIWWKSMMMHASPLGDGLKDKISVILFSSFVSVFSFYYGGLNGTGWDAMTGLWMLTKMVIVPFIIWNYTIGITVYVHHINDKIEWRERTNWSPFHGQVLGTVNYHIPALTNIFFHDIFVHMPHHVHMKIPFYHLNDALQEIKNSFGQYVIERKSVIGDYLSATKNCKLYDVQHKKWLKYSDIS